MAYVDNNLISGENVTYRGRLHWILLVKPGLVSLVLLAADGLLLDVLNSRQTLSTNGLLVTAVVGIIIAALPIIPAFLSWKAAEFSVTNKRVVLKVGFINSKTAEMFLNKIESVGVDQNISGRILNYGDIVIRGTGGSLEPFRHVSHPLEFRRQIQEQIGKSFEPPGVKRSTP